MRWNDSEGQRRSRAYHGSPPVAIVSPGAIRARRPCYSLFQRAILLCHVQQKVNAAMAVAPLVVVPAHNLEEPLLAFQVVLKCGEAVVDAAAGIVNEVGTDQFFVAVAEDVLEIALAGLL